MTRDATARRPVTDDLVRRLAQEAGRSGARPLSSTLVIAAVAVAAVPVSLAVVLTLLGARTDLPAILGSWIFLFKVAAMLLLAGGGLLLVRAATIPGSVPKPALALAPALLFLVASALADRSGLPLAGARPPFSVFVCVGSIVMASLPALALVLVGMRRGIPTRLRRAGFFAGLLAGAVGALAYTVACVNDGAAFVALWYLVAVVLVAGLGAAAGPRALAW
ncbi:NrsF family protein [Ancylobacter sp. TS-1]|uniref:NrsF family protein n=1 Tax=Ancylobacter sp. TS-1 TaxID=1850374 RepID=UPI001265B55B|nr:DUF1109 domain-containing protein [Ancylobacter sp. TS-1]QFR33787.1 DUF1109 family protein [Ancylobacter sp. TS-1]